MNTIVCKYLRFVIKQTLNFKTNKPFIISMEMDISYVGYTFLKITIDSSVISNYTLL